MKRYPYIMSIQGSTVVVDTTLSGGIVIKNHGEVIVEQPMDEQLKEAYADKPDLWQEEIGRLELEAIRVARHL